MNDIVDKVAPNWAVKPETLEAVNQSLRVDNRALRRTTEFLRVQVAGLEMTEGDLRAKLAYAKDLHEERERAYADLQESKAEMAGELAEAHARVGELELLVKGTRQCTDERWSYVAGDRPMPAVASGSPLPACLSNARKCERERPAS